jgi:hypothetical protein
MKNPIQQQIQIDVVKKVAHQFLGMEHFSLFGLLMVVLFFLGAGWLPDAGTNLLLPGGTRAVGWWQLSGSFAIFSIFGLLIRHSILHRQQVKIVAGTPPAARILIIFLSSCDKRLWEAFQRGCTLPTPEQLLGTSWEMPLLAIRHHLPRLEQLYVFTSAGEKGTHQQFTLFHQILAGNYPELQTIELTGEGTDFENMAEVHRELDQLYARFDSLSAFTADDIMLDITGGQKSNSIAGALATLAEGRQFQYISTVTKQVLSYDLVIDQRPQAA